MRPYKTVDLSVIAANARCIRALCDRFYAVVKADAYGHGLKKTVRAADADGYCVARVDEALEARRETGREILVMGCADEPEAEAAARAGITLALTDLSQISGFVRAARRAGRKLSVWIKVDTGMHRFGLTPDAACGLTLPPELVETGRFSHLADSDPERVSRAVTAGGERVSYAATQNLLRLGGTARIGLGLYGYGLPGVRPAMTVCCRVLEVRDVRAGEYVGYGTFYRASADIRIAIAGIGYGDGMRRTENRGWLKIGGRRYPQIGAVCMDSTIVDVTGGAVAAGDEAVLPDAAESAADSGGIPYEYLTCWTPRVERRYIEETR